jgi:hypothetical protein
MRTETFCIEFKTQESFNEFWGKYAKSMLPESDRTQFQMLSCGTGNYISKYDRVLKLLGMVWDAFECYNWYGKCPNKTKIVHIADKVVESGDFDDEYFRLIGGTNEMDRLEKSVR